MALADYVQSYLGKFGEYLGWGITEYNLIVSETLEAYGVNTEVEATNTKKLHSLAKVKSWEKALVELAQDYNFSADGGNYSRSQSYEMAKQNYLNAVSEAQIYLGNYEIETGEVIIDQDPYIEFPLYSDRVK